MKELANKQESLLTDMEDYSQRNKAYALERAQALILQQKNEVEVVASRQSEQIVQNGLR